jgi:5-methylcytosine-specific restriction endonuclease McrA
MASCDIESSKETTELSSAEHDRGTMDESYQQSFGWFEEEINACTFGLDDEDPEQVIERRKAIATRCGKKASELRRSIRANQKRFKFCSQECSSAFQRSHGFGQEGFARKLTKRLIENDFRCELTGVTLTTETIAVDHIIPLSKGGKNDYENIQIVHATVNRMKGTLSQDEFITWCKRIAAAAN